MSNSPFWFLALGVVVLLLAAAFTWAGELWLRTEWIRRADEPKRYWFWLAMFYLIGVILIAVFFVQV